MPTLHAGPVSVTVPATSANLGPGYDALGLALGLRDTVTAEVVDGPDEVARQRRGRRARCRSTARHLVTVARCSGPST